MKMMQLKCPECGAPLTVDTENPIKYCSYCGMPIYFDDETQRIEVNYHSEHVIRDEARIKEAENRREEIEMEKDSGAKEAILAFILMMLLMLFIKFVFIP